MRRPQALALASFLAAALLCLGAVAASPIMSVAGKFALDGMGMTFVDQGIDHLLVFAAAFVMCFFR